MVVLLILTTVLSSWLVTGNQEDLNLVFRGNGKFLLILDDFIFFLTVFLIQDIIQILLGLKRNSLTSDVTLTNVHKQD